MRLWSPKCPDHMHSNQETNLGLENCFLPPKIIHFIYDYVTKGWLFVCPRVLAIIHSNYGHYYKKKKSSLTQVIQDLAKETDSSTYLYITSSMYITNLASIEIYSMSFHSQDKYRIDS